MTVFVSRERMSFLEISYHSESVFIRICPSFLEKLIFPVRPILFVVRISLCSWLKRVVKLAKVRGSTRSMCYECFNTFVGNLSCFEVVIVIDDDMLCNLCICDITLVLHC